MNRYAIKGLFLGLATISLTFAQLDFKADVINFRDATKQSMATTHYGSLNVNSLYSGVNANVSYVGNADYIGVYGRSVPAQFYGIGGSFEGGYMGVRGTSYITGTGSRYAGYFVAGATPTTGLTVSDYGVCSSASGGTYNYGVYASAPVAANSYAGYFSGNVYISGTLTNPSDERLKENIKDMDNSLPLVLKLKPKTYNYVNNDQFAVNLPKGKKLGLIAQDVEQVFPELVQEIAAPQADTDKKVSAQAPKTFKSVDYISLIPVLIGAIQDQQKQIDKLTAEVIALQKL
jgi:hypothetical protein